jgi:hypothetical protein
MNHTRQNEQPVQENQREESKPNQMVESTEVETSINNNTQFIVIESQHDQAVEKSGCSWRPPRQTSVLSKVWKSWTYEQCLS